MPVALAPPLHPAVGLGAGWFTMAAPSRRGSAGIALGEEGVQQGWIISGELKTFRNYFLNTKMKNKIIGLIKTPPVEEKK